MSPIIVANGAVIYVAGDSPGGNGSSWATAFKYLQDALVMADANDEIRVARGIYFPDRSNASPYGTGDRSAAFHLANGVSIRGGYDGLRGGDPNARNIELYATILSGDLDGDDDGFSNNDENSYNVVYSLDTNQTAVLDGFTITAGNGSRGGGFYNWQGNPTVLNCKFVGNFSASQGGGMYNMLGYPTVLNCEFVGNFSATQGGGMYNLRGGPSLTGCTFRENFSGTDGGGIHNHHAGSVMTNCVIVDNTALQNGGGVHADELYISDMVLVNCTIAGNEAYNEGGGVSIMLDSIVYVTNCILWDNIAYEGPQVHLGSNCAATFNYCCVQGGEIDIRAEVGTSLSWGSGNINADPCFADAHAGNYHLKSLAGRCEPSDRSWLAWVKDDVTSPCIDAGDPNSDWTAELWPHGRRTDIGARGGTPEASMSLSSFGNASDINLDDMVDFYDYADLSSMLGIEQPCLREDIDRNGKVDHLDLSAFAGEWLWNQFDMANIQAAIELYKAEFGVYPPSGSLDVVMADYCGAMKLCEAMVGQDLWGFHPTSVFRVDGLDVTSTFDLYHPLTLSDRIGPFLPAHNALEIGDIWGRVTVAGPFLSTSRVLCDMYKRLRPSGKETGMPILYYRADPNGTLHDASLVPMMTPFDSKGNIYNWIDNIELLFLGVPGPENQAHPLEDPVWFYEMTRDKSVTTGSAPYNPDSYILISAGRDGLYGTADDLTNFGRKN